MPGRTWLVPIALLLVLAGCAGPPATTDEAPLNDVTSPQELVSETHGAVKGFVVNDELVPIANASVTVGRPGQADTRSDLTLSDGTFRFGLLEPGVYTVDVEASGFSRVSSFADVRANEVAPMQFILSTAASQQPYVSLQIQQGMIACGFAGVIESFSCYASATAPVTGDDHFSILYTIPAEHRATIVETDWADRGQALHNWFWGPYDETLLVQPWLGDAVGRPPLHKAFLPGERASSIRPFPGEHASYPEPGTEFQLQVQTFYDGYAQGEANSTAGAVCAVSPRLGYCSGVGLALGFRFSQFVTTFVLDRPVDLSAYSALPDG